METVSTKTANYRINVFSTDVGTLTLFVMDCPECGIVFGIPATLESRRREDGKSIYCPNGHTSGWYNDTTAKKLEREKARNARLVANLDQDGPSSPRSVPPVRAQGPVDEGAEAGRCGGVPGADVQADGETDGRPHPDRASRLRD